MLKQMRIFISLTVLVAFIGSSIQVPAYAQTFNINQLPVPGTMVSVSPSFEPALIKGLTVHKDNPFLFDFIVDPGQSKVSQSFLKDESDRMIKYFFAALTLPDKDVWVNLSPYEKDRMIPVSLGETAMGRDLLAQDYMLKQLTASLIYPQKALGKTFWARVYAKAQEMYGTTQIPINTFNKVWIVPQRVGIYEHGQTAFIVDGHLKVMLEQDYLSMTKHNAITKNPVILSEAKDHKTSYDSSATPQNDVNKLGSQIIRSIILPEIEKEINDGKNFATLRQIFYAQALAVWFKNNLKQALLNRVYANKGTVKGIDQNDAATNEAIYHQYLRAYKKGVFNFIQEDKIPCSFGSNCGDQAIARKYFSGGYNEKAMLSAIVPIRQLSTSAAMVHAEEANHDMDAAVLVEMNQVVANNLAEKAGAAITAAQAKGKVNRRTFLGVVAAAALSLTKGLKAGEEETPNVKNEARRREPNLQSTPANPRALSQGGEFLGSMVRPWDYTYPDGKTTQVTFGNPVPTRALSYYGITNTSDPNFNTQWLSSTAQMIEALIASHRGLVSNTALVQARSLADGIVNTYGVLNYPGGQLGQLYSGLDISAGQPVKYGQQIIDTGANADFARALIDLYTVTGAVQYLTAAQNLMDDIISANSQSDGEFNFFINGWQNGNTQLNPWISVEMYQATAANNSRMIMALFALSKYLSPNDAQKYISKALQAANWLLLKMWNGQTFSINYFLYDNGQWGIDNSFSNYAAEAQFMPIIAFQYAREILAGSGDQFTPEHYKINFEAYGMALQGWLGAEHTIVTPQGKTVIGWANTLTAAPAGSSRITPVIDDQNAVGINVSLLGAQVLRILGYDERANKIIESILTLQDNTTGGLPDTVNVNSVDPFTNLPLPAISNYTYLSVASTAAVMVTVSNPQGGGMVGAFPQNAAMTVKSRLVLAVTLALAYFSGSDRLAPYKSATERSEFSGVLALKLRTPGRPDWYHNPGKDKNGHAVEEYHLSGTIGEYSANVKGGIDLSEQDAALQVTKDANGGVKVNVDPALIARIEREGMSEVDPVIINMQPADARAIFGVEATIKSPVISPV